MKKKLNFEDLCPALKGIFLLKGKWSMCIIHTLLDGTKRFKELEREVIGVNTRMLSKELKFLEKEKIVRRKAYATIPPTVEYSLTEKGKALENVIVEIGSWAEKYA
ncbi:winged helix-turn-helix transcriptional regulator [Galbibacter sp.]|uniref:winged helix-turn-helix transcriptional regulator n=1 Tax=Galbibacter sp. TaxID=2918471 RepID=UPI002C2C7CB3|nr:winged helix-turn-helix transcriptional regulator [Galbibacter sp.]HLV62155.1 winged helix-turn-helix transcriptional regulator [Galbibacter sp.]